MRDWLSVSSGNKKIDGHVKIVTDYVEFRKSMREIAEKSNLDVNDLTFTDYCLMVEETLRLHME